MNLVFRAHTLRRMIERGISPEEIREALTDGEVIEEYAEEPLPGRLVLADVGGRPLHVVAAEDVDNDQTIVLTVYEPDPARWEADWKTRRHP